MRYHRLAGAALAALTVTGTLPAAAANDSLPIEIQGVALKGATRAELRDRLQAAGLRLAYQGDSWDEYDPAATKLAPESRVFIVYTPTESRFASAMVWYPTTTVAGTVVGSVTDKYGQPVKGPGATSALWERADGTQIRVALSKQATTLLSYTDRTVAIQ
jgi:hypothetical protein